MADPFVGQILEQGLVASAPVAFASVASDSRSEVVVVVAFAACPRNCQYFQ